MVQNDRDAAIVRASIELAHNLGLSVVAEDVEHQTSSEMLARLGCDVAQGFYLSRSLAAEQLVAWLEERTAGQRAAMDRERRMLLRIPNQRPRAAPISSG